MVKRALMFCLPLVLFSTRAWAVQEHGGPEAIYVHQMAHVFFTVSMLLLIAVLTKPLVAKSTGWRKIRSSAFFFVLWNITAFLIHFLSYSVVPRSDYVEGHQMRLSDTYAYSFYFGNIIENVFLALAFVMLALGLKRLLSEMREAV